MEEFRRQPTAMREAFVFSQRILHAAVQWSQPGSNHYRIEKTTMTWFRDFVQEAEGIFIYVKCLTLCDCRQMK